jgi:hypothetical protein
MVIREAHAVRERVLRELRQAVGVGIPLRGREEARALVQRLRRALDAVLDFPVHHDLRAVVGEELQVRADGLDLFLDRALRKPPRVPARNELEPVRGEHLAQRFGLAREFVAELEALVADALALGQRDLQRRLAAEGRQVVVRPGNRVDADLDLHV